MPSETSGGEGQPHGRYYAEYVQIVSVTEAQEQLRGVLDAGERKEWHLVGVAGGLPDNGMILFWDTARPSFGRRDYR
jgi:hypothetical protein